MIHDKPMSSQPEQWVPLFAAHEKIYPRSVKGRFSQARWVMVWVTQLISYGLPWLQLNDRQLLLFDLARRRFFVGPFVLYPQDFIYLTALLIISALSLFLFTAVAGRLWCGYTCPQTVYTEIFLWVERRLEGDRNARIRLDTQRWSMPWVSRKLGKHAVWIAIGLWTGFSFVGYFTPIRTLWHETVTRTLGSWEIVWVLFYGFATYGNAGFMREQVCKYMCPYARFQSAMFDRDTLIISYDKKRGDPRGSRSKSAERGSDGLGDCIDCTLCVQVCPTGIDIRNGLQYECIGCAACIDVCDTVMQKMNYPTGLVRYTTQRLVDTGHETLARSRIGSVVLRPRVLVYTALVWMLMGVTFYTLMTRHDLKMDVVRDRGIANRIVEDGQIENVYRIQLMNTAESGLQVRLALDGLSGAYIDSPVQVELMPAENRWIPVRIRTREALSAGSHHFKLVAESTRLETAQHSDRILEDAVFVMPKQ